MLDTATEADVNAYLCCRSGTRGVVCDRVECSVALWSRVWGAVVVLGSDQAIAYHIPVLLGCVM